MLVLLYISSLSTEVKLVTHNILTWTTQIEKILPKLSSACFALRSVKPFVSIKTLKIIYYAYFHSIMSYGIIFWGHTALSVKVFRLQKKIIRTMMGKRNKDSCRKLFKGLEIFPLPSLYIYFLL